MILSYFNQHCFKLLIIILCSFLAGNLFADDDAELAKKLQNPVAALISVPFQYNYDSHIGTLDDGQRSNLNIQPVIPFSIADDWNVISRTIIPLIDQQGIIPGDNQTGVGDILQTFFFSPKKPTASGLIWGVGPAIQMPTASNDYLGNEKWSFGPSFVALKQAGPWTYGTLSNHLWSTAGNSDRVDVSATFIQPFLSYTTPASTTFTVNSESTYDWEESNWGIPVNFMVSHVYKVMKMPVSVGAGLRYWAEPVDQGAEGLGARFVVTFLFPK